MLSILSIVAVGIVGLILVLTGVLLVVSPTKYYPKIQDILSGRWLWGDRLRPADSINYSELRVVAAILAMVGFGIVIGMVTRALGYVSPTPIKQMPPAETPAPDSALLITGVIVAAAGIFVISKSDLVLEWMARGAGARVRPGARRFAVWYVRFAGVMAVVGGGFALYWSHVFS
jgi:hypothetical protein